MIDISRINSATKYPSIETYHRLDPKDGSLLEEPMSFGNGEVILTEKVDGHNGRIIVLPDGDFFIGSREELFHAKGDRVWNKQQGIVDTLMDLAYDGLVRSEGIVTYYFEVYGGGGTAGSRNYTTNRSATGFRLFDISFAPMHVLELAVAEIAEWRDRGGQEWGSEDNLLSMAKDEIPLTPRLGTVKAADLPTSIEDTAKWLDDTLPKTLATLDESGRGVPEGIVLRTPDRRIIAKAKFSNYHRTLRLRGKK